MPSIDIILPVYNVFPYLTKCLDSICRQTFKDFELVIIDDCGQDSSISLCQDILKSTDINFRIIRNPTNLGLSESRNVGIACSSSPYVLCLDSDDWVDVTMLETLYSAALSHNADIVSCKAKQYWEIDETYSEMSPTPSGIYTPHQYLELLFTEKTSSHVWLRLLKRELFNQIQFPRGVTFEDVLTLPLLIKNSNRIVQLPNTLYFYRQRNSKTSITGSKPSNLEGFILCLGKIEGEFTYSPEQSFLFRRFAYKVLFFIAFNVSHYNNNFQESKRDLTSIRRYLKFDHLSSDIRKLKKDIKVNSLLYLLLLKVNPRLIFVAHKRVFYKRFR